MRLDSRSICLRGTWLGPFVGQHFCAGGRRWTLFCKTVIQESLLPTVAEMIGQANVSVQKSYIVCFCREVIESANGGTWILLSLHRLRPVLCLALANIS